MTANVYELFRQRFSVDRSRPFIDSAGGRVHSYRDLEETCGRYARLLRQLGVEKGDRVAGQVEKSAEAVFLYLAVLGIGAIYMPLTTAYRRAEMEYFLSDAAPNLVVREIVERAQNDRLEHHNRIPVWWSATPGPRTCWAKSPPKAVSPMS